MKSFELDSTDVAVVEDFVSAIYSKMRIGATGPQTRARIVRRELSSEVCFDDLDYSFDIGYAAEPPPSLIICDVISNTIRRDATGAHDRDEDTFGPGEQFLISRPGLPYGGMAHATRLRFTLLDPAVFTRFATGSIAAEPVRILSHRPVSHAAKLRLQRAIAYVRDDVMPADGASPATLLAAAASQLLAASVLDAYPNTAVTEPTAQDNRDARPSTVTRAVAFIETNLDLDLDLTDIAHAAYVSPRALQLAFRRHLDTTPLAYLRRMRLAHARDDLRSATPGDGNTVTSIASHWGFTGSGFAKHYRAEYGEHPVRTLRR